MVLLFVVSFFSCGDDESEIGKQPPLYPLNIGNTWTYELTTYNGGTPQKETIKSDIKYYYEINGQKGFSPEEYIKGEPFSLLENDNEGNCIEYFFDKDVLVHKTIAFKKNIQTNGKWNYKSVIYTNGDYSKYEIEEREITCTSSDTVIVTPKGSFHCMGFSYHPGGSDANGNPNHTMVQYFSENIGLIKYLHYEHYNGKTTLFGETVLIDYSVKF
jgi:hypothetical protein